mgnify:CR=1 FL=1
MNLDHIVASGHSSGFPAVSNAAVLDNRIKALISFDASVPRIVRKKGLDQSILLFRASNSSYTDLFFRGKDVNSHGTIYDINFFRVYRGDFYDLVIDNTTHNSIYDEYLFAENKKEKELSIRNHKIIMKWTVAFLEKGHQEKKESLFKNNTVQKYVTLRVINALKQK